MAVGGGQEVLGAWFDAQTASGRRQARCWLAAHLTAAIATVVAAPPTTAGDDALALVLAKLPPAALAAAEATCRRWRDVAEAHALWRRHAEALRGGGGASLEQAGLPWKRQFLERKVGGCHMVTPCNTQGELAGPLRARACRLLPPPVLKPLQTRPPAVDPRIQRPARQPENCGSGLCCPRRRGRDSRLRCPRGHPAGLSRRRWLSVPLGIGPASRPGQHSRWRVCSARPPAAAAATAAVPGAANRARGLGAAA